MGLGITSELHINTGSYGSPTWDEADLIADASVNANWEEGDASTRRTRVKETEPTQMNLEITGRIRVDSTDAAYQAIKEAFIEGSSMDVLILNGPIDVNGSHGYRFDGKVFNMTEDQSLGSVIFREFTIKPCISVNVPQYVMVEGGTPAFTDIGEEVGS
jgi:hypothetical protein